MRRTPTSISEKEKLWHKAVKYVTQRARMVLQQSQIKKPPFPPESIADVLGIKVIKDNLGNIDGLLIPLEKGFEIRINITHSLERQNYSCAHEIAHTFFYNEDGKELIKEINDVDGESRCASWEEKLCNVGAAELLMPYFIFRQYASHYDFCILSLRHLSCLFKTSIQATANRLSSVSPKSCFMGISLPDSIDGESEKDSLNLPAKWAAGFTMKISSGGGRFTFPRKYSRNSKLAEAYRSDAPVYSQERMNLPNFTGLCNIESQGFGNEPHRFIVSLIFPEYHN